jgi:CBS domain-containing protein
VNISSTIADAVSIAVADWPVAVVSDDGVVLGALSATAIRLPARRSVVDVMIPAPATIRPDLRVDDVMKQLINDKLEHVYVTTASGVLVGIVDRKGIHV